MISNLPEELQDRRISPKYQQVVECILSRIKEGVIKKGEKLPSIFELSAYLNVSKDTVEKAYHQLNLKGITTSFSRRGYFVISEKEERTVKILFIIGEMNYESKLIYEMLTNLDLKNVEFITYCYKNNQHLLETIVMENSLEIDYFLLSPEIQDIELELPGIIKNIPDDKLLLTKRGPDKKLVQSCFFELDNKLKISLETILDRIKNYEYFNLVLPQEKSYYLEIIKGFKSFCKSNRIKYKILDGIEKTELNFNESYFVLNDENLSDIIGFARELNYTLMEDIGVLSLQDAPFKKYIEGGITAISLDIKKIVDLIKVSLQGGQTTVTETSFLISHRNSI